MNGKESNFILTSKIAAIVALAGSLLISIINQLWVWPLVLLDGLLIIILII